MSRFVLLVVLPFLVAADWPRFRGPNGAGVVSDPTPTRWTSSENLLWAVDLPGRGNGSPIIVAGKIYLQAATSDGTKRMLVCLDARTGASLWTKSQPGQTAKTHVKNSLASSTPACDGERIFACFWDGKGVHIVACDLAGKDLWTAPLGTFSSQHGVGMSPTVHDGKVFVNFDQDGASEIMAFDSKTGEKVWAKKRTAFRACYATPIMRNLTDGAAELIVFSTAGATAYDPATGTVRWNWEMPAGKSALRAIASPMLADGLMLALLGDGGGGRYTAAITPGTAPAIVWEKNTSKLSPYVPSPVVKEGHFYWVTDEGFAECVAVKTGKVMWSERVFNKSVSASLLLVGDEVLMIDEGGKAVVLKASPREFEKLSGSEVGEAVFATPAAAAGKLYIRGATKLLCVGTK